MLVTAITPLVLPATVGSNVTVSCLLVLAAKVKDVDTRGSEKPVPEIETPDTVTGLLPVLVSVSFCEVELPTGSLPKLSEAGDGVSTPRFLEFAETISTAA